MLIEACSVSVYIRNRLPHSHLHGTSVAISSAVSTSGITPYEVLYETKPSIAHLLPFGEPCYIQIHDDKRISGSKLYPRAEKAIFVGYTDSSSIYRVQLENKRIVAIRAANCTFSVSAPALAHPHIPAPARTRP